MGGCQEEQFERMAPRRAYPLHRAEPLIETAVGGTAAPSGLRLRGTCSRRDEVSEHTRLPSHQYRRDEKPCGGHPRSGNAAEAICLSEQSQHLRCHQGATALRGNPRDRHAPAQYGVRSKQVRGRAVSRLCRLAHTLYYIKADRSLRSQGERLLCDGEEHPATYGLRCGLQASGHHLRLCDGCGTGRVPRTRPWR